MKIDFFSSSQSWSHHNHLYSVSPSPVLSKLHHIFTHLSSTSINSYFKLNLGHTTLLYISLDAVASLEVGRVAGSVIPVSLPLDPPTKGVESTSRKSVFFCLFFCHHFEILNIIPGSCQTPHIICLRLGEDQRWANSVLMTEYTYQYYSDFQKWPNTNTNTIHIFW